MSENDAFEETVRFPWTLREEFDGLARAYGVEEHSHYGNVLYHAIEESERLRVAASILAKLAEHGVGVFNDRAYFSSEYVRLDESELAYLAALTSGGPQA